MHQEIEQYMENLLYAMEGEYKGPIMVGLFILFACVVVFYYKRSTIFFPFAKGVRDILSMYCFLGIWFGSLFIIDYGFRVSILLLETFEDVGVIASFALCVSFVYSVVFLHSICRIVSRKKGALHQTRFHLLALPLFLLIFPFPFYLLCAMASGSFPDFSMYSQFDPIGTVFSNSLFAFPWAMYFWFSPTLKQLWEKIDTI